MRPSWEDPHPGQRIPLSMPPGACGYSHALDRGTLDGVAAKAGGTYSYTRPLVRKSLRTRQRNPTPRHLKVPGVEHDNSNISLESPDASDTIMSRYLAPSPCLSGPGPISPLALEVDTDTETEVGILLEDPDRDEVKVAEIPSSFASFTDLSSFLDVSIDDEVDFSAPPPITVVRPNACGPYDTLQSPDDLYGWEAELERKVTCGITNTDMCRCDTYQYENRPTSSSKRGLLHRVFTSGRRPSS